MIGQLTFQFVIAAFIFFALVVYVSGLMNSIFQNYIDLSDFEIRNEKLLTFSEALLKHGLTEDWPVLNKEKIEEFCNMPKDDVIEMYNLKRLYAFGPQKYKYRLEILDKKCGDELPSNYASIKRFAILDNKLVSVFVAIW
ncbi:MAG: hypothetical protein QXP39_02900 [Candidatus Aenigmatarchaeota archaeon]